MNDPQTAATLGVVIAVILEAAKRSQAPALAWLTPQTTIKARAALVALAVLAGACAAFLTPGGLATVDGPAVARAILDALAAWGAASLTYHEVITPAIKSPR